MAWTREESEAWRAVVAVQAEQRAMSLTDAAGGFMVPFHLDPAITLTSNGSVNPLRDISRVVQTASDSWNGVTSADPDVTIGTDGSELAAADVYALQNALPPRFQPRAAWLANLATLNAARQFETANGSLKFPDLQANPPMLLVRRVYENSNMDTAQGDVLVYGDFSKFVIVDRIGSTLELVQNLFGDNGRLTGQRGALLWFRIG